jgi:hypothetical protein
MHDVLHAATPNQPHSCVSHQVEPLIQGVQCGAFCVVARQHRHDQRRQQRH